MIDGFINGFQRNNSGPQPALSSQQHNVPHRSFIALNIASSSDLERSARKRIRHLSYAFRQQLGGFSRRNGSPEKVSPCRAKAKAMPSNPLPRTSNQDFCLLIHSFGKLNLIFGKGIKAHHISIAGKSRAAAVVITTIKPRFFRMRFSK